MEKSFRLKSIAALAAISALALTACTSGGGNGNGGSSGNGDVGGESFTMHAVTILQPSSPSSPAIEWFYSQLEERSDGRITVDRTAPEALCKAPEIAECVRDGRADVGVSVADYTASMFPSMSVASIPFMVNDPQALMAALYEVNTTFPDAVEQWESLGIEYVAAWSPGSTIIGTNGEVNDLADLNGLRLRATGASLPRALDEAGASVVAISPSETYESVERGVVDAVAWGMDGPTDWRLMELLSDWTDPGVGAYTTLNMWMNKGFYDSLPDDLRTIVDEVRDEFNAGAAMEQFAAHTEAQCTALLEFPNTKSFTAWDASVTEEWKSLVQDDLIAAYIQQAESDGLADAQGYFDAYVAALEGAAAQSSDSDDPVRACIDRFAAL